MHALGVGMHSVDVVSQHLLGHFVPISGFQVSFGELLYGLLLLPHHGRMLPSIVFGPLASKLIQDRFVLNLIVQRLLDEIEIHDVRPGFFGDLLYFDLLLMGVGRVLLLLFPHLRFAPKARDVEGVEEDQRTPVGELDLFFCSQAARRYRPKIAFYAY